MTKYIYRCCNDNNFDENGNLVAKDYFFQGDDQEMKKIKSRSISQHVANGTKKNYLTSYMSFTKLALIAEFYQRLDVNKKSRYVVVDTEKLLGKIPDTLIYDLTDESHESEISKTSANYAKASREVLIKDSVPEEYYREVPCVLLEILEVLEFCQNNAESIPNEAKASNLLRLTKKRNFY